MAKVRWKNDRTKKKKAREKAAAEARHQERTAGGEASASTPK